MTKRTDPLNRVTRFEWCKCGALRRLTDPMGRTTTWRHDVQGRVKYKEYTDGFKVSYLYENTTSRLRQRIDEKLQVTQYNYYRDNAVGQISYADAAVATPPVTYTYDGNYRRVSSMTDGIGTTLYKYYPISPFAINGAGKLASIDGPLPNTKITYSYDVLGRQVARSINNVTSSFLFDGANRVATESNVFGNVLYVYDGATARLLEIANPNPPGGVGQTTTFSYLDNLSDRRLERITHAHEGTLISEFTYGHDVPANRITTWTQKSGTEDPLVYSLGYDAVNQLTSATAAQSGSMVKTFVYTYDAAGNRLSEQIGGTTAEASYNALNQMTTLGGGPGAAATYQWDGEHRLVAINIGDRQTEFSYDGLGRRVGIRALVGGVEVANKRYVWSGSDICEERTPAGAVVKRFFSSGMKIESGPRAGDFFYTRDHLDSIRELTDASGSIRARYSYDPFGRRTRLQGDLDADFGFTGTLFSPEANLNLLRFRVYDPNIGRWLSRDPLFVSAEITEGPNLYGYVTNNPVNLVDPWGLSCCELELDTYLAALFAETVSCGEAILGKQGRDQWNNAKCAAVYAGAKVAQAKYYECLKNCPPDPPAPPPPPPDPCEPFLDFEIPSPCNPAPMCEEPPEPPIPASF